MVQAVISIPEDANRILNIVKAKHGLKDKSEAVILVIKEYEQELLEPELKPEYKQKLIKITKGRYFSRKEFEKEVA